MAKKRIGLDDVNQGAEHLINSDTVDESETTQVIFECSKIQKQNIRKAAKLKGLTVSGYIRFLIANDGGLN